MTVKLRVSRVFHNGVDISANFTYVKPPLPPALERLLDKFAFAGAVIPSELTLLTKTGGPLTKRISLREDGSVKSDGSACVMAHGLARRIQIANANGLAALIGGLSSNQALALGRLRDDLPEDVKIVTRDRVINGVAQPGSVARTGNNILYREGHTAWALLDYDAKGMPSNIAADIEQHGGFLVALRSDQDEIVVHHVEAPHTESVGDELLFLRLGMNEHDIGIAAPRRIERLAGALRDHPHLDASLRLEQRQEMAEQARILGRGGGGDNDGFFLRESRRGAPTRERDGENEKRTAIEHAVLRGGQITRSPRTNAAASGVAGEQKNCRAGARSRMRPPTSSTTSPASRRAWPRSCVAITTLTPLAAIAVTISSTALRYVHAHQFKRAGKALRKLGLLSDTSPCAANLRQFGLAMCPSACSSRDQ